MEDFVIQGCGPIGLYSTVVARESGARTIIVVGAPQNRLELAKRWGADHVINIDEVKTPEERKEMILGSPRAGARRTWSKPPACRRPSPKAWT